MTVGMFLAALAFYAAALVQIQIDVSATQKKRIGHCGPTLPRSHMLRHKLFLFQKTLPTFPSSTEGQVKFINMLDRELQVTADKEQITLQPYKVQLLSCRTTAQLIRPQALTPAHCPLLSHSLTTST